MYQEQNFDHNFCLQRKKKDYLSIFKYYRPVTQRVHDTLPHLVPEQPPADHGHGEVDCAQNWDMG